MIAGEFGTPSEYIRDLIRQDRERRAARLEDELLEAIQSRRIQIDPEALQPGRLVDFLQERLDHPAAG